MLTPEWKSGKRRAALGLPQTLPLPVSVYSVLEQTLFCFWVFFPLTARCREVHPPTLGYRWSTAPPPARPRHGSVSGFCELIAVEVSIRNVWLLATIIWPDFLPWLTMCERRRNETKILVSRRQIYSFPASYAF